MIFDKREARQTAEAVAEWTLRARDGTGLFVCSPAGTLLCRVDPERRVLWLWDKRLGREIAVSPLEVFATD